MFPASLVFLHGVGHHAGTDSWRTALSDALRRCGYKGLPEADNIIAPDYSDLLEAVPAPLANRFR
jgi:hypothetical protein